jgi:hypothetical protein
MKQLLTAAVFGFALALAAQAQTVVHITGSTAFRSAAHNAIKNILGANVTYGFTGTSFTGASQAIFTGWVGGQPVVIKTSWSGSTGGYQTVAQAIPVKFLPDATPQSAGGSANAPAGTVLAVPDVGFGDTLQAATPFNSPVLTTIPVGVIPFKWVASNGAPAGLTNLTPSLAQALFGAGKLALSLFTGNAADEPTFIFATGRDPDSGTRTSAFGESGVGVFSPVVQMEPVISGAAVTDQHPWPVTTVNGITFELGNGGFSSGGTLATAMTKTTAAIGGFYVTYLGLSDATNAIAGGAKELTWNGVPYSDAAVKNGRYTFWSFERITFQTTLAQPKKDVATTLAQRIIDFDSPVLLKDMRVERFSDGGVVVPKF